MSKSSKILLIDGKKGLMSPLRKALEEARYQVYLFQDADQALMNLAKTDILIMDVTVARQPKSSKLIKVPTILVLASEDGSDTDRLPPWLEVQHVFLLPYPEKPQALIKRLPQYTTPHIPDLGLTSARPEHLALLFGITQALSGHLDLNDLFERILALAPHLEAEFSSLLIQEGEETIYYRSTQPGREELIGPAGRRFGRRLLKEGLEGWVLRHHQAVVLANTRQDSRWLRASYLPDQEHCVVALPIRLERVKASGMYLIGHRKPGHFSEEDVPLLEAAVTQIGMAIENAMLFKNQSERSVQLSLINEVSQAATSILNLDVMLGTVVQAIRRSFAFYSVSVHLYNPINQTVVLRAKVSSDHHSVISSAPNKRLTHRLRQGLIGWAAARNKTVLANDVMQDPRYMFDDSNREVRSELCIPIALGVKIIGVLCLQSTLLEAFDRSQVAALETLADQLAIAIENARLYDEINRHVKELKSLNEINQAVTSTLDLQKTLKLVTDHTIRLMDVAAASVALRDDTTQEVWFAAASGKGSEQVTGWRLPLGQGLAGWVAAKGEAVIVPDVSTDHRFFEEIDQIIGFKTRSILCVPLQTKGYTIGALEVLNKRQGTFGEEDLSLLQALAISVATAIENAQLYEEQGQTIKRLAETQSQLVQSAKLAAVGELAAGVAHEINNPLTTIIGLTSLLLDIPPENIEDESYEDLQMVNTEARRARDIVRNLLDFARTDQLRREATDLNQLIEDAILLVYNKSVSLKVELLKELGDLPEMFLDPNQFKQVFVNLLNNAIQAMWNHQNGPAQLKITTAVEAVAVPSLYYKSNDFNQVVVCKISDTGMGIKGKHLDKIFDPFFTTKEVGQGTGLGLSISYGIIKQHGGDIKVKSKPGHGTTFILTLPILLNRS